VPPSVLDTLTMGSVAVFELPAPVTAERGIADPARERWGTTATQVTLARTVVAVVLGVAALATHALPLVVAGYAVYWAGDVADGWLARRLDQETRRGAVADIVGDRICTLTVGAALVSCVPWTVWPVGIFLVQFAVVDLLLSLGFLRWPLLSPNYFHLVDRQLYRLNWSLVAKASNTSSVVVVTLLSRSAWLGAAVATGWLAVKLYGLVRMGRLWNGATRRPATLPTR
jgi:phosphatidylglycerophosphate synthase